MDAQVRDPVRLRATGASAVAAAALLLVVAGSAGVLQGTLTVADLLLLACPAVALAAVFLLPVLVVGDDGLDVVGVLHRRRVPWDEVVQVRQAWFVELDLRDGSRVACLAAPVVGSMAAFRTLDEDGSQLLSRRSAQHPAFHGARRSLAVELVEARRPARAAVVLVAESADGGRAGAAPPPPGGPTRRVVPALLFAVLGAAWCAALVVGRL